MEQLVSFLLAVMYIDHYSILRWCVLLQHENIFTPQYCWKVIFSILLYCLFSTCHIVHVCLFRRQATVKKLEMSFLVIRERYLKWCAMLVIQWWISSYHRTCVQWGDLKIELHERKDSWSHDNAWPTAFDADPSVAGWMNWAFMAGSHLKALSGFSWQEKNCTDLPHVWNGFNARFIIVRSKTHLLSWSCKCLIVHLGMKACAPFHDKFLLHAWSRAC